MSTQKCPKCDNNLESVLSVTTKGLFTVFLCTRCCYCCAERNDSKFSVSMKGDTATFEINDYGENE